MLKGLNCLKFAIFWVFILSTASVAKQDENSKGFFSKVLLIDSEICLELIPKDLLKKLDKIESQSPKECQKKFQIDARPFHGQLTLVSFLTHLEQNQKIHLIHLNPFNVNGQQNIETFRLIHKQLSEEVFSAVMMPMAGLLPALKELNIDSWRSPVFLASGQKGAGSLSETQFMWPHSQLLKKKSELIFIVGTYLPLNNDLVVENTELFHIEQIDLYLSENESFSEFTGSSRATAEAAAKALNFCHETTESFLKCLKNKMTTIPTTSGREVPTL